MAETADMLSKPNQKVILPDLNAGCSMADMANRREIAPFGLNGGSDGAVGNNFIERADGRVEHLPATASAKVKAGDVMVIATPGGRGFGVPGRTKNGRGK